ncbi:MAG: hypothetical protein RSC41_00935 [Oscillospiraceae bacterium]
MKKKLLSICLCATLLGTMCTSAFAGMDMSQDMHTHTTVQSEEKETQQTMPRGHMCDCGRGMVRSEYYTTPWTLIKKVECRLGKPNCADLLQERTIIERWTCGTCERYIKLDRDETRQICGG